MPIKIMVGEASQLPLPLFALRKYERVYEEDGYILILTHKNIYTLDYPEFGKALGLSYFDRRDALSKAELKYPLYPLSEVFSTISQLVNSKRRVFIGEEGIIYKYKPSSFCQVEYARIAHKKLTDRGSTVIFVDKVASAFKIVDDMDYTHVGYIRYKGGYILYELCHGMQPTARKKV